MRQILRYYILAGWMVSRSCFQPCNPESMEQRRAANLRGIALQNQAAQQGKNGGPTGGHGAGTTAGHHRPEFHYSGWRRLLI